MGSEKKVVTTIGVIGGGQLCRMMGEEIQRKGLPYEIITLDPTERCPAFVYVKDQIVGAYSDESKIQELARRSDVITYEFELAGAEALGRLESEGRIVHPSAKALGRIQDKFEQAIYMMNGGIPCPMVSEQRVQVSPETACRDLEMAAAGYGLPLMLKARRGSYDGKGNYVLRSIEDIPRAITYMKVPIMAQEFIDFEKEISIVAARSTSGVIKTYPVCENVHKDNILDMTIAPARISIDVRKQADDIANKVLTHLNGAGVFGIEMFVTKSGKVLLNEVAPRVHNSGHYTIEACVTSQFEQHLHAVSGAELGDTSMKVPFAVMKNIIGDIDAQAYEVLNLQNIKSAGAHVHMYGKHEVRKGRKMGHFTVIGDDLGFLLEQSVELRGQILFRKK